METLNLSFEETKKAAKLLNEGEVLAFPTETVFGLGVVYDDEKAFEKLVEVKNRPERKPFTLMCSSAGQASKNCHVNVGTIAVFDAFMPGEITVLVSPRENLPNQVTLGSEFIGIRVPGLKPLRDLIEEVGKPLLVPSANKSGEKPALTTEECKLIFGGEIAGIIEGETVSKAPSTIVKIDGNKISLVREGPIAFEDIKKVFDEASMRVSVGSDHGAFDLKNTVLDHLRASGFEAIDEGTNSPASCDYPFFAKAVAEDVASGKARFGIVLCTSGEGVAIAANKVRGIRCGIGYDDEVTLKTREHNNANCVAFGAKYMQESDILKRIDIFLATKFSDEEKHHRRVKEIEDLEK